MQLYEDDKNDSKYINYNSKGQLIGIRNACEEIRQICYNNEDVLVGGICYVLAKIISLSPIIENFFEIKELNSTNGIRKFEVKNKAKNNSKIVDLRIGKIPGVPKSVKGIDIQVLLEYLKEEIKEVDIELINKLQNLKNKKFDSNLFTNSEKEKLNKILIRIVDNFKLFNEQRKKINKIKNKDYSVEEFDYEEFIEKDKDNNTKIKNLDGLMNKILSDEKNFDYIIDNIPGFLICSGRGEFVSSILTGRPSKKLFFKDYKNKEEELKELFEKLYKNSINELNFLTISIKGHEMAVKDLFKIKDELFVYIRNPWGNGNEEDIDSKESDKILEGTEFSKINQDYKKTGLALLNLKDILKTFLSMSILDFESGKYHYSQSISKSQLEKSKGFDFILDMKATDNIKFDVVNFNSDLQYSTYDSKCLNYIQIFDEKQTLIKKIEYLDIAKFSGNNIIDDLEKGKKYLIRAFFNEPCNLNIIRNNNENTIKFLGEANNSNFNFKFNYTEEDKKKNNYLFKDDIKKTVKLARVIEKLYNEPCIRQFKKISDDEIVLEGTTILNNKLLFKVVNDLKKEVLTAFGKTNEEIIKIDEQNKKIIFFDQDITKEFISFFEKQKEWLLDDNKIGIIDDQNNAHFIEINELEKYNGKIKNYIVPTLNKNKDIFGKEEISIKNNIFSNQNEAIKKIQEIAKINAGLIKDFMTGGVEFENPKIFKNFLNNFYTFPEHIIAFKCKENAISDIKNVLNKILNKDIKINSIQEVWETILDELINGYIIGGCLPFISLHFNEKALLYSVMNINYKHTITGHVLTFIDYFLKGFVNGAFFDEKFVYDWYENQSNYFNNSVDECKKKLFPYITNLFKYIYNQKLDFDYETTNGIFPDMLINKEEQYYLASNRIIGKMNDEKILNFEENILYPEFNFKVEGDLDPLPSLIKLLNEKQENRAKWEKTKIAHEIMKKKIKLYMDKLPFLKGYFYLLDMITFAIYYLVSITSLSAFPDIKNSIKEQCSKKGKFYLRVIPSVFPPLPTTIYIQKEFKITFQELSEKIDHQLKDEITENIYRILNNNLKETFNDNLKKRILKEIEKLINTEIYNRYNYELSISNIEELKFCVKKINEIYEQIYPIWENIINQYKNLIKEFIERLNNLRDTYLDLKSQIRPIDINNPLHKQIIIVKGELEKIYQKEEDLYIKLVSERIIHKNLFNSNYFTLAQIEPIAKNTNDNELITQIEKYKAIIEIKFIINKILETFNKKDFYHDFNFEFRKIILMRKVGYHEGKGSYRGGCLVDFNEEIELKEKKDSIKLNSIKEAIKNKKEEIKINNESYFLVKTKMKSTLYDKKTLMEINLLKDINLQKIIRNISKKQNDNLQIGNGLSQTFLKLLSNNKEIVKSITLNDLTKIDESNENLLIHIPSIKNSDLIKDLIKINNKPAKISYGYNMITPLLSSISIKNLNISEILINKRYNINDSTDIKFTPLHFASYFNLPNITRLLLANGASDNLQTKKEGEIPLHLACRKGNFEIVDILLNNNTNSINMKKSDNKTSLHLASITSSLCTQILLRKGANIYLKDNNDNLACKLALIYGREDIFNMIGSKDRSILNFYEKINKFDNDIKWDNNNYIIDLCKYMRKNDLRNAEKYSDLIIQSQSTMTTIKNDIKIQEKIIRNACKGKSIDYLYILLKIIELKNNISIIYENIYKYYLIKWIPELEKKGIIFDTKISEKNWSILSYLFINDILEFNNLINKLEEIPEEYLSKLLYMKCKYKIEYENFENIFIKFKPKKINIESFSKTSDIDIEDMNYLLKVKDIFHIDFSTFDMEEMIKNSRPSVVKFILSNNKFMTNQKINLNNLENIAKNYKRLDNLQIIQYNKYFFDNMANIFLLITDKGKNNFMRLDNNIQNFNLYEFDQHGTIFNLINETQNYHILDKITNFQLNLLNNDILFKNFDKIIRNNILEIPLKDIIQHYLIFFLNNLNNVNDELNNTHYFSYFIELIDIIIHEQAKFHDFDNLFEKTINSLIQILGKNNYNIPYLITSKTSLNQNIMHVLAKEEVFVSKELKKKFLDLLEILILNKNEKYIKNLFNDKDKNSLTFLMYLIILEKHELFTEIYLKYKKYINPFIFEKSHNNILHYIILNMKDDQTQKSCLDNYIIIIKDIIMNNPNIIFTKNINNQTPLLLIIKSNNNMTGLLNLFFKLFSYETLQIKEKNTLLYLIIAENNLFMLRYLIEYQHIKINQILEDGIYPLNLAAFLSKIDIFEFLIQYGANPFFKNRENLDTINYAMRFSNYSFLEHIYNMKISELCFRDNYLFDLVGNKKGYEIFIKLIREKKIELNIVNSKKETLLMKSCQNDNYELINILLNYGINALLKDENNNTALHHCCICNSKNALNILLQNLYYKSNQYLKKSLSSANINDDTPLHLAAKFGNLEVVQKILVYSLIDEKKKNIRFKSKGEFLPIHYAIINDKIDVAFFLMKALDIDDEEIENIEKDLDSFSDKINKFINSKNQYMNIYEKKIGFYINKLKNDIDDLKSNNNYEMKLQQINEINELNDIYELNILNKGIKTNFYDFLNIFNLGKNIIINNESRNKLLKYYNYINKDRMINKIIELVKKGLENYLFNFIECLDKSDWMKYEKLENIVNLFISNIFPFTPDEYYQKAIEIIDLIINNKLLKDKSAYNFLSWVEIIIISISEDISEFPTKDIIIFIQEFYEIILEKLKGSNELNGLKVLTFPYSNIKFYYFIKQLISILKKKARSYA